MVIVILGLLSAFALPKFASLGGQASSASFDGHLGAFRSGVKVYYSAWLTAGKPTTAFGGYSSVPATLGFPAGGSNLATAFGSDCATLWQDILQQQSAPVFVSANHGWSGGVAGQEWSINATPVPALGEGSDVYCHFVFVGGYFSGGFAGDSSDRVPAIQYNIQTGEVAKLDWPFNP